MQNVLVKIILNGKEKQINANTSLLDLMLNLNFEPLNYVAIVNGNIIPKSKTKETELKDGDEVEIITIMGGG